MSDESKENAIIQNLKDAGCSQETIAAFMEHMKSDETEEGMKLLAAYRRSVLEEVHKEQKKIDCLDYLIYKMKKTNKSKREAW